MMTSAEDVQEIHLKEGLHLVFPGDYHIGLYQLFALSWMVSAMMGGKPVLCKGFLPGASFWVQTDLPIEESFPDLCKEQWADIEYDLWDWVEEGDRLPCKTIFLPQSEAYIARDAVELMQASITIERYYSGLQ